MRGSRWKVRAFLVLAALVAGGCARSPGGKGAHDDAKHDHAHGADGPKVVAVAVDTIGEWEKTEGVTLTLGPTLKNCSAGHLGAVDAVVKAQHTGDVFAIRVSWPDATRSDTHKSLVWDEGSNAYGPGEDMEDRLSLMFNIDGDFSSCMLAGKTFRADVWQWKAARTAPAGLAQDKYHLYSLKPVHEKSKQFINRAGTKVYMARVSDAGDGLYAANTPPETKTADTIPGYVVNTEATGSIADVRAEAVHDGTGWTVTLTRKLDTRHDDDVVFEKGKAYESAIACFDRSDGMHHSTAGFVLVIK